MLIDRKSEELNLKIACHGPDLSGKTANLGHIDTSVDPRLPGELISLETQEDRTLFVDSLRLEAGLIRSLDPRSSLYAVPGEARKGCSTPMRAAWAGVGLSDLLHRGKLALVPRERKR